MCIFMFWQCIFIREKLYTLIELGNGCVYLSVCVCVCVCFLVYVCVGVGEIECGFGGGGAIEC